MNQALVRHGLRGVAVIIALAAAVDPAVTSQRRRRPEVAIVAADPARDAAQIDRVERALGGAFTVIRAPLASADASVLVGGELPTASTGIAQPAFALLPERNGATVTLDAVQSPAVAGFESRVPVAGAAHVTGARGRTLDVTLRSGGLVVDRASRPIDGDDERVPLSMSYVPTALGAAPLRLSASIAGDAAPAATAAADRLVDVRDVRWQVLFFDARPSWMSTFVRRAVERDRRFVVTSRVITSRGVSLSEGRPPNGLDDIAGVSRFDAIVVGAPDALTDGEVAGLEAFLRQRGGGVTLLLDQVVPGPYQRLTGPGRWLQQNNGQVMTVAAASDDSTTLRAADVAWPAALPEGSAIVAQTRRTARDSALPRPLVWRSPVGAGQLVVSGALDAWRYRDRSLSRFEQFWRSVIAQSAQAALPAVDLAVTDPVVPPGETANVGAVVRSAFLSTTEGNAANRPVRTSISAGLEAGTAAAPQRQTVRFWPGDAPGALQASFRAPRTPGIYRLIVLADGSRAEAPLVVSEGPVLHPMPEPGDLVAAWAAAHGGRALPASRLSDLPGLLDAALVPRPRMESWHPMRSAWWMLPFVLALSAEWWLRRRRGLA